MNFCNTSFADTPEGGDISFGDIGLDCLNIIFSGMDTLELGRLRATCKSLYRFVNGYIRKSAIALTEQAVPEGLEQSKEKLEYDDVYKIIRLGRFKKINFSVYFESVLIDYRNLIRITYKDGIVKNFIIKICGDGVKNNTIDNYYENYSDIKWNMEGIYSGDVAYKNNKKMKQDATKHILQDIEKSYMQKLTTEFCLDKGLMQIKKYKCQSNELNKISSFFNSRVQIRLV